MNEDPIEVNVNTNKKYTININKDYFDDDWFIDFRKHYYDIHTHEELIVHIMRTIIINGEDAYIDGVGHTLVNGNITPWSTELTINHHVNIKRNLNIDVEVNLNGNTHYVSER